MSSSTRAIIGSPTDSSHQEIRGVKRHCQPMVQTSRALLSSPLLSAMASTVLISSPTMVMSTPQLLQCRNRLLRQFMGGSRDLSLRNGKPSKSLEWSLREAFSFNVHQESTRFMHANILNNELTLDHHHSSMNGSRKANKHDVMPDAPKRPA